MQQCPSSLRLISNQDIRGCGRLSTATHTCDSIIFPSGGRSYSRVCGRVNAYQKGSPDAFTPSILHNVGLEGGYIDGVSLTHGTAGSRQHIWSFVAAPYETGPRSNRVVTCPCTNINWPYRVPSFVSNSYFCATANPGHVFDYSTIQVDDPLWDGEGCGPTNSCCEFNNPPWFCKTLPQPTMDNIEVRVCHDEVVSNEDIIINLIDINVM